MPDTRPWFLRPLSGILLTLLFVLLWLPGLSWHSYWTDELHTYGSIVRTTDSLVENRLQAGHLPTWFLGLKAWAEAVGYTPFMLRLFALLGGALAWFAFWLLVRDFVPHRRTAGIALALFFFHPWLYWASHEARMYSAFLAFSILPIWSLLHYARTRSLLWLLPYFLFSTCGLSIHMLFLLQLPVHLLFLLQNTGVRNTLKALPFVLLPLLVMTPLLMHTLQKTTKFESNFEWQKPSFSTPLKQAAALTSTDFEDFCNMHDLFGVHTDDETLQKALRGFAILFLIYFVWRGWRWRREPGAPEGLPELALLAALLPSVLISLSEIFGNQKLGPARYATPGLWAVTLLAAHAIGGIPRNRMDRIITLAYPVLFAVGLVSQMTYTGPRLDRMLDRIAENRRPDDAVVMSNSYVLQQAFGLYQHEDLNPFLFDRYEPDAGPVVWWITEAAKDRPRVWVLFYKAHEDLSRNDVTRRLAESGWRLVERYRHGENALLLYEAAGP